MIVGELSARLQLDDSQYRRSVDSAGSKFAKFGGMAAKWAGAISATVIGAFTAAGAAGIKMAADMEQSRIAFTTLLGSAEQAETFLKQLSDFASRTPFEFPGLVNASRQLLAFGFQSQEIIPMMTAVGNAVAGLGGGAAEIDRVTRALGQMQAKGKVSAEEMGQLAELGIPVWQMLADKIGVSIPQAMKMAEQGAVSAGTGINAILEGMNSKFGGMMEQQSTTLLGLWSTAKDNLSLVLRTLGEKIIETFDLKTKLAGAVEWLGNFAKFIEEKGTVVFDKLSQAIDWFRDNVIAPFRKTVGEHMGGAAGAMEFFRDRVLPALQQVWGFIQRFVEVIGLLWAEWGDEIVSIVGTAFSTIWSVIENVFKVINGLLDVFIGLFTGDWNRMVEGLKRIWSGLWNGIKTVVEGAWDILKTAFGGLWEAIKNWFKGLATDAMDWGRNVMQGFKDGIVGMFGSIKDTVGGFVNNVTGKVKNALEIKSPSGVFMEIGANVGKGFALGVEGTEGLVQKAMGTLVAPSVNIGAAVDAGQITPDPLVPVGGLGVSPGGSGPMILVVELDGRQIARQALRYIPGEVARAGVRVV